MQIISLLSTGDPSAQAPVRIATDLKSSPVHKGKFGLAGVQQATAECFVISANDQIVIL